VFESRQKFFELPFFQILFSCLWLTDRFMNIRFVIKDLERECLSWLPILMLSIVKWSDTAVSRVL
jgi:hypothetical protein